MPDRQPGIGSSITLWTGRATSSRKAAESWLGMSYAKPWLSPFIIPGRTTLCHLHGVALPVLCLDHGGTHAQHLECVRSAVLPYGRRLCQARGCPSHRSSSQVFVLSVLCLSLLSLTCICVNHIHLSRLTFICQPDPHSVSGQCCV